MKNPQQTFLVFVITVMIAFGTLIFLLRPTKPTANNTNISSGNAYTSRKSYQTPGGTEEITLKLNLNGNNIVSYDLNTSKYDRTSALYQESFEGEIGNLIVGQNINSLNFSRVGGASLTTGAFNAAIDDILAQIS